MNIEKHESVTRTGKAALLELIHQAALTGDSSKLGQFMQGNRVESTVNKVVEDYLIAADAIMEGRFTCETITHTHRVNGFHVTAPVSLVIAGRKYYLLQVNGAGSYNIREMSVNVKQRSLEQAAHVGLLFESESDAKSYMDALLGVNPSK